MQREELEDNKNKNKNKTTKTSTTKRGKEDYSPRVKSLKDFVQLFDKKSSYLKNPLINKNKE
jgi:hypothetical protein